MLQELPMWAYIVVGVQFACIIALYILCTWFANTGKKWGNELMAVTKERDQAKAHLKSAENALIEKDAQIALLNEGIDKLKLSNEGLIAQTHADFEQIDNVRSFVRDNQLTLRPKKGKLFTAFNEEHLEKVLRGEEIA